MTGPERDGLIQLTREARQPGWWHSFRDVLPNPYEVHIGLEAGAASIRNFEPSVVPGLLQTADYARETFRNGPIELDPDGVERLVEVRLARQKILTRDNRPRLWAVIDEAVIRRVVGGGPRYWWARLFNCREFPAGSSWVVTVGGLQRCISQGATVGGPRRRTGSGFLQLGPRVWRW